jgi:hypothetical protein
MNKTLLSEPDQTGRVRVYIRPRSDDLRELTDEIATICTETVGAFGEFYTPGSLSAGFCRVGDPEVTEATFSARENVATHSFPVELSDPSALEDTIREFGAEQNANTTDYVYLSDFEFDGSVVRIYIPAGDVEISEDSPEPHLEHGDDPETAPDNPPFYIQFAHFPGTHVKSVDPAPTHVYALLLYLNAETYFEDSLIGEINRARVREGIARIRDRFDVIECTAAPDRLSETRLNEELLRLDGPTSEQLLQDYRKEWAEREIVGRTAQYTENGETVFEITSDAAAVQTAELRARIEAYVDHQREQGNAPRADRLRIVRTDGTKLEARVVDGTLEWADDASEEP